jgi:hypothetical protein
MTTPIVVGELAFTPDNDESRDDMRRRLDAQRTFAITMKEEQERSQRRIMALEGRVQELLTEFVSKEAEAAASVSAAEEKLANAEAATREAEVRCASAIERLKIAPQADRALRCLAVELASLLAIVCKVPAPPEEELRDAAGRNILELVEQLRLAVRRTTLHVLRPHEDAKSPMKTAGAVATFVSTPTKSHDAETPPASPTIAVTSGNVSPAKSRRQVATPAVTLDEEKHDRTADAARRECAGAKQENRNLSKTVADLSAQLKRRTQGEVSAVALDRVKREAAESKKHMTVALVARQQELELAKKDHAAQVQELMTELTQLRRQVAEQRVQRGELETEKHKAQSLTGQLTRSGQLRATTEIERLTRINAALRDELDSAQAAARSHERRAVGLEREARLAAEQYNAVFAAHAAEEQQVQRSLETLRRRAVQDVLDDGRAQIAQLKEQYLTEVEEKQRLRRKLHQVLVSARHAELSREARLDTVSRNVDDTAFADLDVSEVLMQEDDTDAQPTEAVPRRTSPLPPPLGGAPERVTIGSALPKSKYKTLGPRRPVSALL